MTHGGLKVSVVPSFGPTVRADQPAGAPPARGIDRVDEGLGGADSEEFELAGTGGEDTTSASSYSVVAEYEPPRDERAMLVEASMSIESNGKARIAANGRLFGPYSGGVDISIPGDSALLYARRVAIEHKSTDGNATTTQAAIVAKEV
jgi:hypothetical protein